MVETTQGSHAKEFLSPDECQALLDHEIEKPTELFSQILHRGALKRGLEERM